jgi:general secretion pathway protein D
VRPGSSIVLVVLLSAASFAVDQPKSAAALPCQQVSMAASCKPSAADEKKAEEAFSKALKLQKGKQFDEAYEEFDTAARLVPTNLNYITSLALVRQQLVFDHVQRGNADLLSGNEENAQGEFRTALNLDPDNEFAKQRLLESLDEWAPPKPALLRVVEDSGELQVSPKELRSDFHFRGDSRELLTKVAAAYGVTASLDESVVSRHIHFNIDSVDFYTAMQAACAVTGTFWTPLSGNEILVARDSAENHRQFDRMALRTFAVPGVSTQQELSEMASILRTIFDIRFIAQRLQTGTISVRAPVPVLDAVNQVFSSLGQGRPQVMLDVYMYEIDHQFARSMGIAIPNNFTLFNIPAAALVALTGLGGQNIQSLINQLISSGGINQANSQAISGLLAQLGGQTNSLFSNPVATFGGGLTLMGLTLGTLSAELSLNESLVKTLEHDNLRAGQGTDSTLRLGSRYPILNASYAPIYNTPAIAQVLQNNSFQAPFPSFTYEDLGLTIKAKPHVHTNSDVSLDLEIELRTLAGQSYNGVPVIANRAYKGSITLMNGEPAVVAGSVSSDEMKSLAGIPGLSEIPGLNIVDSTQTKSLETDELMVIITPHVLSSNESPSAEVWMAPQH